MLKAAVEFARDKDRFVLIEATANQVNQYGGYTGMKPGDFRDYVRQIAAEAGLLPAEAHIGRGSSGACGVEGGQSEEDANGTGRRIDPRICGRRGFEKIHIDTSMRLGDDPPDAPLSDGAIAARAARLCAAAEEAYQESGRDGAGPVYVIGSEVPGAGRRPGRGDDEMHVTSPRDLEGTVAAFREAFRAAGLTDAFGRVIAIVVQPGGRVWG